MPERSDTPAARLAGAEAAQAAQAARLSLERAAEEDAAGRTQERSREEAAGPVQGTRAVEGAGVQGESRGAHAHVLAAAEERTKTKDEAPPAEERPADPQGRGAALDVQA